MLIDRPQPVGFVASDVPGTSSTAMCSGLPVHRGRAELFEALARAIGGTERTIKAHRHRVMEKLQVQTIAELVSLAERAGILADMSGTGQMT
jgi:hypothetical protein